jgi:hypothetical protein
MSVKYKMTCPEISGSNEKLVFLCRNNHSLLCDATKYLVVADITGAIKK